MSGWSIPIDPEISEKAVSAINLPCNSIENSRDRGIPSTKHFEFRFRCEVLAVRIPIAPMATSQDVGRRLVTIFPGGVALDLPKGPPKILIADDNLQNVELLEAYLAGIDCDIRTAIDGEDTLRVVEEFHPDLLLLDVMMPRLSGFEVCKKLRADSIDHATC